MSASYALINRIKTLEQQKKRNNQLSSTAIKAAAAAAAAAASAAIQSTPNSTTVSASYQLSNNNNTNINNSNYISSRNNILNNNNSSSSNNLNTDFQIESLHSMNLNNHQAAPIIVNNLSLGGITSASGVQLSPNTERKAGGNKFNRSLVTSFSKSQEELFKLRTKSANPNVYQDKITDQKFFNRNFRLKSDSSNSINEYNNTSLNQSQQQQPQRYLNDSPSTTDSFYHSSKIYTTTNNNNNYEKDLNRNNFLLTNHSPVNHNNNNNNNNGQMNNIIISNQQNLSNNINNKLKLLKKRNALKKSLSNATSAGQGSAATSNSVSTTNLSNINNKMSLDPLIVQSLSKEDLKLASQNSLNNLTSTSIITARNLNQHLSRYSLNNIDSSHNTSFNTTVLNNSYSYPQLNTNYNKSSETIDELGNDLMKQSSYRAKSTGPNHSINSLIKTKSENELNDEKLINLQQNNYYHLDIQKTTSNLSINNNIIDNSLDKTILNKLMNLNEENVNLYNNIINSNNNNNNNNNNNTQDHSEDYENTAETIDLIELNKKSNANNQLLSTSNAKFEKARVNITIKPQSAVSKQEQEPNVVPIQVNDSRINKAVIANNSYLNRVKNVSSSHYNTLNHQNNSNNNNNNNTNGGGNITISDQRNFSFNQQRVKSGRLTQINNETMATTTNENLNRNSKIKLNNENNNYNNQISNYQNYYSNDNNNNLGPNSEIKQLNNVYIEYSLDQIDPNNIMSDPVISEQFRKLYAEDEYFQAVHRKCTDWLHRYVMPEFDLLQAEKIQK
jgi:hypothetical protein